MLRPLLLLLISLTAFAKTTDAQSVARIWNEQLLEAIRNDFARPTVHARNLYHVSLACYDAWAVYDTVAETHFLGKITRGFASTLDPFPMPSNLDSARDQAISYAAYRILRYRFRNSPNRSTTWRALDSTMVAMGYNPMQISNAYQTGNPAALGNHIATELINYGNQDGSNDAADYVNQYYEPLNGPLVMDEPGNPDIVDPDRWQALSLSQFVDQSGNPIPGGEQEFLSPEWGNVVPFAMTDQDSVVYRRDSSAYPVYHDPGPPPYITDQATREAYQRGFEMVATWSGLCDPSDGIDIDISPAVVGQNVDPLPDPDDYYDYYDELGGGDNTGGLSINPITGQPYAPNVVKRGDYARVLAEFWADGPDSETPPGHWFDILNYVMDQPLFSRKWKGQGLLLDTLEYDVKAYLSLGGAMHDAAIATWSIKGWYDYLRPVSAIRYMAEKGQRSDPALPRYHEHGFRLEPGFIEMIDNISDPLAGPTGENIGEIKLYAWRGPDFITDPDTSVAGVGWILAKEWWPYQRPTFVSPPFAGYVSGHSTYSRAAAEVLTSISGSAYFPGGLGTFDAPKNEFLVFEDGPSEDVQLQWATYRDASDEVSLSRIYGGIHPPADDIPGRRIGIRVAADALALANQVFDNIQPEVVTTSLEGRKVLWQDRNNTITFATTFSEAMDTTVALSILTDGNPVSLTFQHINWLSNTDAEITLSVGTEEIDAEQCTIFIENGADLYDNSLVPQFPITFVADTRRPTFTASVNDALITDQDTGRFVLQLAFDEAMDTTANSLSWNLPNDFPVGIFSTVSESWLDDNLFEIEFNISEQQASYADAIISVAAKDSTGNDLAFADSAPLFSVDFISNIKRLGDESSVSLWPTVVTDFIELSANEVLAGTVLIYNSNGQAVESFSISSERVRYDLPNLSSGHYIVELLTNKGSASWQIIK